MSNWNMFQAVVLLLLIMAINIQRFPSGIITGVEPVKMNGIQMNMIPASAHFAGVQILSTSHSNRIGKRGV